MDLKRIRYWAIALVFLGVVGRLYGLTDPWKTHDHYNFGGVWTTSYAECLKTTPLSVSKGIPHTECWTDHPLYYRAHEPTILFAMWGWTSVFGSSEAAYRLFIFFFSAMNVFLIYKIARVARPDSPVFAWLAAAFQSVFLGGIYFGTHPDFIGEFTVFFVLLSAWAALRGRLTLACVLALGAGLSAWPGYIAFGSLFLYTLSLGRGRKRVVTFGLCGFALALATMMWLHQTPNILDFLRMKLFDPGYIKPREKGFLEPLRFVHVSVYSMARLLSPVFAAWAFFELVRGEGRAFFQRRVSLTPFHHAVLLSGMTGLLYALIGHEYFMVHVFLFLLMTPGLALLCARFVEDWMEPGAWSKRDRWWLTALAVLFAAAYPYGVFKSNAIHDALNSVVLAGSALAMIWLVWRSRLRGAAVMVLMSVCALANLSQTINYRNEPDTERSFCLRARAEYEATHQPVHTHEPRSDAKSLLYCRDLPVVYE